MMYATDFRSEVWSRFEAHLRAELEKHRVSNDADLTAEKTALLRGRIRQIKEILALPTDTASQGNDQDD